MSALFRGAAFGNYWHKNNAEHLGFKARANRRPPSGSLIIQHIRTGTTFTPYISLTRSYGIAFRYATSTNLKPSKSNPAYIYQIDLPGDYGSNQAYPDIVDPIKEIVGNAPSIPGMPPYHHDGDDEFLLGVIDPTRHRQSLVKHVVQPPPQGGIPRSANLTPELEAIVRALRDSELLAVGHIPKEWVYRIPVW